MVRGGGRDVLRKKAIAAGWVKSPLLVTFISLG
jgi:hypothetical protein